MSALPSTARAAGRPTEADAAADLYARHSDRIFGYCLGLLRNREEAEDAVQTTFLNAYRGLRRGVTPEFEAAWLFKIAQNVCRTRQANASRRGRIEMVRDLDSLQDAVAAPERDAGEAAALAEALQELPERYRTVILLREWQGLSYREIAAATGDSEAAVEMLVFRARRALAAQLERADVRSGALSLGSVMGQLKSLFGGAALKAVATGIAVTATTIAVTTATGDEGRSTRPQTVVPPSVEQTRPDVGPHRAAGIVRGHGARVPAAAPIGGDQGPAHGRPAGEEPSTPSAGGSPAEGSPPSASPTVPPRTPPTEVAPPPVSVPSVTVPSVPVPGTSLSTPSVSAPAVTPPEAPPLPVAPPELPLSPPDVHLP